MIVLLYFSVGIAMGLCLIFLGKKLSVEEETKDLKKENMNIRQESAKLYKDIDNLRLSLKLLGNDIDAQKSRVKDLLSVNEALGAEINELQKKNVVLVEHVNFLHSPKDIPITFNETEVKALSKALGQPLKSEPKRKRTKPAKKKKNASKKA